MEIESKLEALKAWREMVRIRHAAGSFSVRIECKESTMREARRQVLSTAEKSGGRKATAEKAGMDDSEARKFTRLVTTEKERYQ